MYNRGAAVGSDFAQAFEGKQASGEVLFEGGEGFGGAGHGGGSRPRGAVGRRFAAPQNMWKLIDHQ